MGAIRYIRFLAAIEAVFAVVALANGRWLLGALLIIASFLAFAYAAAHR
jgi:hypothetical protein